MIDLRELQKEVMKNKLEKGFNTTDVALDFCRAYEELSEAFSKYNKGQPGVAEESDHGARTYMRAASVGMLRSLLVQDGASPNDAKDTTSTCSLCGSLEEWDQATELVHKCSNCREEWDQDENAARNILARREQALGVGRFRLVQLHRPAAGWAGELANQLGADGDDRERDGDRRMGRRHGGASQSS